MNTVLKYKLGVKSPKDDSLLSKETVERELYLAETPVMLELSYDKPEVKTRAMKSCLSESGEPVNISVPLPNMKRRKFVLFVQKATKVLYADAHM